MAAGGRFVPLGEQQEDEEENHNISNEQKVISLINEAQLAKEKKMECLLKVRELIINKDSSLLDNFFEEVMAFQQDSSVDVRKFVVSFLEEACKKDSHMLPQAIPKLRFILQDKSTTIQKKVIVCIMQLYRTAISYILKLKSLEDSNVIELWEGLSGAKKDVLALLDSDNDGVKSLVIKFIEMTVLTQTKKEQVGEPPLNPNDTDLSLDMIPADHGVLKLSELRDEATAMLRTILELTTSETVSSVTLMTCISTLSTVARQRPIHMSAVIQTFEILHGNLPQHFSSSQLNSVAKHLKSQVLSVLRHPLSYEYHPQLTTLLTALGSSQSEIAKNMPKRPRVHNENAPPSKKQKISGALEHDEEIKGNEFLEAVDITTNELKELLVPETVVELVIANMGSLPDTIPTGFRHSFTPIAAAGTQAQITQTARLLASQMTSHGMGSGAIEKNIKRSNQQSRDITPDSVDTSEHIKKELPDVDSDAVDLTESVEQLQYLGALLGLPSIYDPHFPLAYANFFGSLPMEASTDEEMVSMDTDRPNLVPLLQTTSTPAVTSAGGMSATQEVKRPLASTAPQKLKTIRQFDLSSIVKPARSEELQQMGLAAFQRILDAENVHGSNQIRNRLIIRLVLQLGGDFNKVLYKFIVSNFKSRLELAIGWLYALYCSRNNNQPPGSLTYDECLSMLLNGAYKVLDVRDRLFTRILIEAPLVTPNALMIVKSYCKEEERVFLGLSTLRDLILKKPQGVSEFLDVLLEVTMSELELARVQALHIVRKFYSREDLSGKIEKYAIQALQKLLSDHPSFLQTQSEIEISTEWNEEAVKICIGPLLTLLSLNSQLLKELAVVYTSTSATVKRILLKLLDQPVRVIGMHSPQLLELVETCPKGAETLIMRILYILTENTAPSPELVKRVRELYQRSSSDVRFLIPVLQGLTKQEILTALPKFIKLSPNVTKGVFERLLVSYKGEGSQQLISPISPSELLIALHTIDCKGDDGLMKAVVRATNLCFQEKTVYTQEVLAVVLQQLVDHTPIPLLLMRTIIHSLGVCPRLMNFVMTILTKLISKQVWKLPKVWQGFIKCCEATVPHSFQVIVQLPPKQLENVLNSSQNLREPFVAYIHSLSANQKSGIPRSVLAVVEKQSVESAAGGEEHKPKKRKLSQQTTPVT